MEILPVKTAVFKERENLPAFIARYIPCIKEGSIIAVTSKIAALSEGRTVKDNGTKRLWNKLIKQESDFALETGPSWLTVKDGMILVSAGIDRSNGNGKIILLPKDPFRLAHKLCVKLKKIYKTKKLGIIITDSMFLPFRDGIVAVAVGCAGFKPVKDHRGKKDIFGRKLKLAKTDMADSIACACAMLMGEGGERCPLAVVKDAPVEFCAKTNPADIKVNPAIDLYRPIIDILLRGAKRR